MLSTLHGLLPTDIWPQSALTLQLLFGAASRSVGCTLASFETRFTTCCPTERLRKLDQHQGFVKGVCWDPVGEFLATQSDDRTVKIWKTTDWSLEAEVTKPFEDSPGSTFFRRLRYVI